MPLPLEQRINQATAASETARRAADSLAQLNEAGRVRIQAAIERRNQSNEDLKGTVTLEALGSDGFMLCAEFLELMRANGWPGAEEITHQPKNVVHIHKMGGRHTKPRPDKSRYLGYPVGYVGQTFSPPLSYLLHRSTGAGDPAAQWRDEQIRKSSDPGPFSPVYLCTDNVLRVVRPSDEYARETELQALPVDPNSGTYVLPWTGRKLRYQKETKSNIPSKRIVDVATFPGATDLRTAPLETVLDSFVVDAQTQGHIPAVIPPINVLPPPTVTP